MKGDVFVYNLLRKTDFRLSIPEIVQLYDLTDIFIRDTGELLDNLLQEFQSQPLFAQIEVVHEKVNSIGMEFRVELDGITFLHYLNHNVSLKCLCTTFLPRSHLSFRKKYKVITRTVQGILGSHSQERFYISERVGETLWRTSRAKPTTFY